MTTGNEETARHDIEGLLPWYAAGTLSRRDAERVEAAIASDEELARQLELVREELAATIRLNETLGAPSPWTAQRLFAAIDAEQRASRGRRVTGNLARRLSDFLASLSPRALAWSAIAAALVIVLQAGVITSSMLSHRGGPNSYETASADNAGEGTRQRGSEVLVRFAPQASATDITKFLKAHNASVVGGPTGDLYRVRVANPTNGVEAIVKAMQGERDVVALVLPGSN
jgi:anti-sigma factor RsiW